MTAVLFDYTRQDAKGALSTEQAWAQVPPALDPNAPRWHANAPPRC